MKKKNILVIFGGCSSEYSVSLSSGTAVINCLDPEKFQPLMLGITQQGRWLYYTGPVEKILDDTWHASSFCAPAVLSPSRGDRCLLVQKDEGLLKIPVDMAFPVLHGKNGEDGTVQGLIELAGIPLAGCGTLSSALCMDKDRAHRLVKLDGIRVPRSVVLEKNYCFDDAAAFGRSTGYPLYVKPVKAGSSYGVSKAAGEDEMKQAIALAFLHDDQVILEENIPGFEVGCAVLGNQELMVGEVDEIELSGGFFDFTEKYTLKTSSIHVPARIAPEKAEEIKETARIIYKALGCAGFARVDLFLTPEGRIYFNEVNTIPGFTEHSRYPGMMKAAGHSFREILTRIVELGLEKAQAQSCHMQEA